MPNKIFEGSIHLNTFIGLYENLKPEDAKMKITDSEEIEIEFDYPFNKCITLNFKNEEHFWNPKGFSLLQIILAIREGYKKLYKNKYLKPFNIFETLFIEEINKDGDKFTLSIGS